MKNWFIMIALLLGMSLMAKATCSIQPRFSYKTKGLTVSFDNRTTGNFEQATWTFGDGVTLIGNNPTHTFTQAGNYAFTLTLTGSAQGCTQTYQGKVYVFDTYRPSPTPTPAQPVAQEQLKTMVEQPALSGLTNYPNPFTNFTTLSFELANQGMVNIGLYDLSGRLLNPIANGNMPQGLQTITIERQDLPAGAYIVNIQTEQGSFSKKVMVF